MAYLGKGLKSVETANISVDTMTGNVSATTMSISLGSKTSISVNDISVFVSGVMQRPGTDYTLSGSTITFTTAPAAGWKVVAVSKGDTWINEVMDGSVTSESIKDGAVTDAKLTGLSASKLTGALPAIDGSAVTGIETYTKSATNPTISTNPSGGVGTVWVNQVSGQMYICTDATAGANVWTNIGAGSGDIIPFAFQGTQYGFCMGGNHPTRNHIQKYSYSANQNATDVADITYSAQGMQGGRSKTHGYCAGGEPSIDVINKFSFTDGNNATDIGNLTQGRSFWGGHGASSGDAVYWHGGEHGPTKSDIIDKRVTATDGDASDVGNLTVGRYGASGGSSDTHGYAVGGMNATAPTHYDTVERYAFASDGNAVDTTQNLTSVVNNPFTSNSTTHMYASGGQLINPPGYSGDITKFAFNSSSHATDIGNLSVGGSGNGAGTSSTTHGYCHGGYPSYRTVIENFTFSSDGNASDVGDLAVGVSSSGGTQH